MSEQLLPGYFILAGSSLDRALLVKFMQLSYQELFPEQDFSHLARTVEQYFSRETPLWWVEVGGMGRGDKEAEGQRSRGAEGQGRQGEKEDKGDKVDKVDTGEISTITSLSSPSPKSSPSPLKIGCLWVGNAIDQVQGDRYAHIFLLYVKPNHRRQGVGTALMRYVESWARSRGDRQIGLQVFQSNTPALNLYHQLGYNAQSLWMVKQLRDC